jgi:hypothetical protein
MGNPELESDLQAEIAVQEKSNGNGIHEEGNGIDKGTGLKLDPHGFPLSPQPSSDPRGISKFGLKNNRF